MFQYQAENQQLDAIGYCFNKLEISIELIKEFNATHLSQSPDTDFEMY